MFALTVEMTFILHYMVPDFFSQEMGIAKRFGDFSSTARKADMFTVSHRNEVCCLIDEYLISEKKMHMNAFGSID